MVYFESDPMLMTHCINQLIKNVAVFRGDIQLFTVETLKIFGCRGLVTPALEIANVLFHIDSVDL